MIKEVEYNDGECRLKGHVEILPDGDGTYTITSYIEDKAQPNPWCFITEDKVEAVCNRQLSGVAKLLEKLAESYNPKGVMDKLKKKGFTAP